MIGHYLMFNRSCADALKVYEKAFGARITEMQKYRDMPPNPAFAIPESDKELVLHARLQMDDIELMCADSAGKNTAGNNMYVSVTTKDMAYVQNAWDVLKEDAEIYMELTPSFFAALHGSLRDRFGISWMFNAMK